MIHPKRIPKKTYKEWMDENYTKIPVYTKEWTNFNPSDPGITILEHLTAFLISQQEQMDLVPDTVREKLLTLMGFSPKSGRCAEVLIEAEGMENPLTFPVNQRFMVGDISFETTAEKTIPASHITGLFGEDAQGIHDYSHILDRDVRLPAYVFGKNPCAETKLYLVMDAPIPAGDKEIVHIEMDGQFSRNPCDNSFPVSFAALRWECYTEDGFVPMEVCDGTDGLLSSGTINFTQPAQSPAVYRNEKISGYVWRTVLQKADYDIAPVMKYMTGFLLPAVQKETLAATYSFSNQCSIVLECAMLENSYVRVFVREQNETAYRLYEESVTGEETGRFYRAERLGYGRYAFRFDKDRYGYAPNDGKNAVKVVLYNEEMMRRYELGEVYGYDNQEISLPKEHIVPEGFLVAAKRELSDGETVYDFFKPGQFGENELSYVLYENEGRLVIRDAGDYIGAKLYLASIAVTLGEEGNVREGNLFTPIGDFEDKKIRFFNPIKGEKGAFRETVDGVRKRFAADWSIPKTAVTAADYELLVKMTPGLCIAKVRAWMDTDKNEVQIVVLPNAREQFARLSVAYENAIAQWLKDKRLLSTRIRIRPPVYTAVSVSGTIYVKPHYNDCREQIEQAVRKNADYINGSQQFGEVLCFDRMFRDIETLACVAYIEMLGITSQNTMNAVMRGADIVPSDDCLLYVGKIRLDILPASENPKSERGR